MDVGESRYSLDYNARTMDPAEELAFLSVECARGGDVAAGQRIIAAYVADSGDPVSARLLDFYRCRRATVRAKLIAWHLHDPQFRDREPWSAQAQECLVRALEYGGLALPGVS